MPHPNDDPVERAEAERAEAARRAAEQQEEEEKRRGAGHGAGDAGNPAHADLGANIRPDVVEAPGGLVTITTQKSATYYPERDDAPDPAANNADMAPPPEPQPLEPEPRGPGPQQPGDTAAVDPVADYIREARAEAELSAAASVPERDPELSARAEHLADAVISMDDMMRGERFLDRLQERIESEPGYSIEQESTQLQNLQADIFHSHDDLRHWPYEQFDAAIGAAIREGTGFTQWPETQELIGDLVQSEREHDPTRGDDHEPEADADPAAEYLREALERSNNESSQRQNAERAAERGDTVPGVPLSPEAEYIASRLAEIKAEAEHDGGGQTSEHDLTRTREPAGVGRDIF